LDGESTRHALHESPVGASVAEPGEAPESNADRFVAASRNVDGRTWHLAAVCDGVSSSPNGAGAASVATGHVAQAFGQWQGAGPESFLSGAVRDANRAIRAAYPEGDALCTVAAALAEPGSGELVLAHAGDSGVFLARAGGLQKLTRDHAQSVPVRMNGRILMEHGVAVMRRGLILCLGGDDDVEPEVSVLALQPGDVLAVASDGAVTPKLQAWISDLGREVARDDLEALCLRMAAESRDDTTVVVVRLGLPPDVQDAAGELAAYERLDACGRAALIARMGRLSVPPSAQGLLAALDVEDDAGRFTGLVGLLAQNAHVVSRAAWVGLLDRALLGGRRDAADAIAEVLRRW
jgi:protein phosphatase